MPIKKVMLPNGETMSVNAPDGATDDQILTFAKVKYYDKIAAETETPRQRKSVADSMSGPQKFFAGMGKSIYDTGRGIGNLVGLVSDEEVAAARELDSDLMETGLGLAGNITGHIGQVLTPGALLTAAGKGANAAKMVNIGREMMSPTSFKAGAAMGAGYNYLQPGTQQERLASAALGGVAGGAGGWAGGKLGLPREPYKGKVTTTVTANPMARATGGGYTFGHVGDDVANLSGGQQAAKATGEKLGFKTTPGQASGSKALQQMEAKLESQPMTSGPFNAIKDHNQTVLNRIAARSIGEKSDDLSSPVLEAAKDRLGDIYKSISDDVGRQIDPDDFLGFLDDIDNSLDGIVDQSIIDDKLVGRLWTLAEKGEATGKQLQQLASKLGYKAHKQMVTQGGDRDIGIALYKVKDYVDNLLESGMPEDMLSAFRDARSQYRNLMLLTQRNGVINPSSGNVAGNALGGLLQQKDKAGFLFNKNQSDLYNAARFAQAFRPIVGDSGTSTRSALPSATDVVLSAPMTMATNAYLAFPHAVTYGAEGAAKALPITGLLGGGMVGREMY